jgi:Fuc2NAc and GlcNAc transferase
VATIGFIDDRHTLPARWRFAGHSAAAAWLLYWAGPLPPVPVLGLSLDLGPLTVALAALYTVWSINFFNFMDGIDGIASIEAISVALGGALAWWLVQPSGDWPVAVLFAACVSGFLFWNFPPARIFMGDAGSGFLGLVVAVLALWSALHAPHLIWSWVVLSSVFLVDATTTLVRRVRRGERFAEGHRNHAYQYAARVHGSHKTVTLAVLAINIVWLLPISVAVALQWLDGTAGVAVAIAPLVWVAFHYKAGDRAAQET